MTSMLRVLNLEMMADPSHPTPSPITCGVKQMPTNILGLNILALSISCLVSLAAFVMFAPPALQDMKEGVCSCKNSIQFGLLSTFCLSTISAILYKVLNGAEYLQGAMFFELIWVAAAAFSRIWMIMLFHHTLWVLDLPNRVGEFQVLVKEAQRELRARSKFIMVFWSISLVLCIITGAIKNSISDSSPIYYHIILIITFSYTLLDVVMLVMVAHICIKIMPLSIYGETKNRMLYCLCGCGISTVATLFAYIFIVTSDKNLMSAIFLHNQPDKYYDHCFEEFATNFILLPFALSTCFNILSLFPFSVSKLVEPLATCCRSCADCSEKAAVFIDDVVCCRIHFNQLEDENTFRTKIESKTAVSILEFGMDFSLNLANEAGGRRDSVSSSRHADSNETGEQTILNQVGSALEDTDTFSLVIPPEFLKINAVPFAAGGFGQVHKGMFCGKQVAVKKVFTQLSEGLLDEFKHEVKMLNNLRGMPHIMLLHGVSFQMDQGERVFIMVLEWCPLSLATVLRPEEYLQQKQHLLAGGSSPSSSPRLADSASTYSTRNNVDTTYRKLNVGNEGGGGGASSTTNWLSQNLLPDRKRVQSVTSEAIRNANNLLPQTQAQSSSQQDFSPNVALAVMKQLVNGLHMLHYKGYVHRDLKPQNILFTNPLDLSNSLRICDFGTSRITDVTGRCSMYGDLEGLSPLYAPPEVIATTSVGMEMNMHPSSFILDERHSNMSSMRGSSPSPSLAPPLQQVNNVDCYDGRAYDMYSLGIILWEIWYQQEPKLYPSMQASRSQSNNGPNSTHSPEVPTESSCSSNGNSSILLPHNLNLEEEEVSAIEMFKKTLQGYRPSFRAESPFGIQIPLPLMSLIEMLWDEDPSARPEISKVKQIIDSQEVQGLVDAAQRMWNAHS